MKKMLRMKVDRTSASGLSCRDKNDKPDHCTKHCTRVSATVTTSEKNLKVLKIKEERKKMDSFGSLVSLHRKKLEKFY